MFLNGTASLGSRSSPMKAVASDTAYLDTDPSTASVAFDYPDIEELDPSTVDGFQLFYEREVPIELRSATSVDLPTEVGALEALRIKLLVQGEPSRPQALRVELSSESNLFFYYSHDMNETSFREMQESQRLMVDFVDYPTVLLRMLNQCVREPHLHLAVFVMQPSGEARLDFIQNMEYKFVELLSARFQASPEDIVRQQVSYRYNLVKARLALMQARLADVNALVKVKNPSLLLQLQRTPPRMPGVAGLQAQAAALQQQQMAQQQAQLTGTGSNTGSRTRPFY